MSPWKKAMAVSFIVGLLFVPSLAFSEIETYDPPLPVYVQPPDDTATIANQIQDITGVVEAELVDEPVVTSAPAVEETGTVTPAIGCQCDMSIMRGQIQELYGLNETRHEQIYENFDYLIRQIDDLQGQIYELKETTTQ